VSKDVIAWTEKVRKAMDKLTLEARIMDSNIPKSEAEWWAQKEITDLRARLEKAEKDAARYKEWKRAFREGECGLFIMLSECSNDEEHDVAIDAAIKAQKEGKS